MREPAVGGTRVSATSAEGGSDRVGGVRDAAVRFLLAAVLVLTGASAVWGGFSLVAGTWDMDPEWLRHTPFDSWTLPGVATLLFPGLGVLLAGAAVLLRLPHHREIGVAAGAGLLAWVATELLWLQVFHPVMHPLIAADGAVVVVLALLLPGRSRQTPRA
ncbi:hypothetical protein KZX45_16785 [Georgenia sp. EYE_87]|uniref:hypothetical protein n=1 Tax=Georgenia sp. EYE_87 TaxID=2853448 RepID=UPI0020039D51|nr:hypothetical protein [Georgenia sp. EYE_87]MCK6212200.1 hypothetical protein [Georgenia sp. EYE_87]